jgi:hypothetical protein
LVAERTTGRRILIYPSDEENDACKGLNRLDQPNDFCQSTPQSTIPFTFNAISFPERHYTNFVAKR